MSTQEAVAISRSNALALTEREFADRHIEGMDFGTKLWVVARSPTAVLVWVYGHSYYGGQGSSAYAQPHLTLLNDRGPRVVRHPDYTNLRSYPFVHLKASALHTVQDKLDAAFGPAAFGTIVAAVASKRTALIDGGGNQLRPPGLHGEAYKDWRTVNGTGFLMLPEGMTEHDACRHKLGWKPVEQKPR